MKNKILVVLMCFTVSVSAETIKYDLEDHKRIAKKIQVLPYINPTFLGQLADKVKRDLNVKCHGKLGRAYDACYSEVDYGILKEYESDIDYYIERAAKNRE